MLGQLGGRSALVVAHERELVCRHVFADRATARRAIFAWLSRYNTDPRHSTLGYISPSEWENHYRPQQATLAA